MSCAEEKDVSAAIQNPGVVGSPGAGVLLWEVWSGQEPEARATAAKMTADSRERSQGAGLTHALSALGLLEIGLGNYQSAVANLLLVYEEDLTYLGCWSLPDSVEAAARTGQTDLAQLALSRLSERAIASGTDGPRPARPFRAPFWPRARMLKSVSSSPSTGCKRRRPQRTWHAPTCCSASG